MAIWAPKLSARLICLPWNYQKVLLKKSTWSESIIGRLLAVAVLGLSRSWRLMHESVWIGTLICELLLLSEELISVLRHSRSRSVCLLLKRFGYLDLLNDLVRRWRLGELHFCCHRSLSLAQVCLSRLLNRLLTALKHKWLTSESIWSKTRRSTTQSKEVRPISRCLKQCIWAHYVIFCGL